MFINEYFVVYPEGDIQEIPRRLGINEMVDINGNPLELPLATPRMIVFRVSRISVKENRGGNESYHYLELMSRQELSPYVRSR